MEVAYTYWEADGGWFVGYLNDYPDHLTQGMILPNWKKCLPMSTKSGKMKKNGCRKSGKSGVLRLTVSA